MWHPGSKWPKPAEDERLRFEALSEDGAFVVTNDGEAKVLTGDIYPDGSRMPPIIMDLSRASWGVAQLDEHNRAVARVSGVVRRGMP